MVVRLIRGYQDLEVWKKAIDLAVVCYRLTAAIPAHEIYGMASQIRRSATSVPANIAEGRGRRSTRDFIRFLDIAYGSLMELETQILLANQLDYMDSRTTDELLMRSAEIGKMLNGLRTALRSRPAP
jgi:four helix bundle protein